MLNQTRLLNYVKSNLGFPYLQIEMSDEDILNYIKENTIHEFSQYVASEERFYLDVNNTINKVPGSQNQFYLFPPSGREILNVKNIYFSMSNEILLGHWPLGAFTMGDLKEFALSTEMAMMTKLHSQFYMTYEFTHPNVVRISPINGNAGAQGVIVETEMVHAEDFSTIPNDVQKVFMDLALADIMIVIGRIRQKYGESGIQSPFGNIPLNGSILQDGESKKQALIDKLENRMLYNISLEIG